jgi:ABC-type transport system substrate-binding protein
LFRSAEADAAIAGARRELDEKKRLAQLHRVHAILNEEAPAIFVANTTQKHAFRRRVRGLATSPLGLFGIWPGPAGWWASPLEAPAQNATPAPREAAS